MAGSSCGDRVADVRKVYEWIVRIGLVLKPIPHPADGFDVVAAFA